MQYSARPGPPQRVRRGDRAWSSVPRRENTWPTRTASRAQAAQVVDRWGACRPVGSRDVVHYRAM